MRFQGHFTLNKQLTPALHEFLNKLNQSRRMGRFCDNEIYGFQGEFYVDDAAVPILNTNTPPITQPSLYCCWKPTEDGLGIEWDRNENFYEFTEWLNYIVNKILIPNDYSLTGDVDWVGDDPYEGGVLCVDNNFITLETFGKEDYSPACGLDMRLDYVYIDKSVLTKKIKTVNKKFLDLECKYDKLVRVIEQYLSPSMVKKVLAEVDEKQIV